MQHNEDTEMSISTDEDEPVSVLGKRRYGETDAIRNTRVTNGLRHTITNQELRNRIMDYYRSHKGGRKSRKSRSRRSRSRRSRSRR